MSDWADTEERILSIEELHKKFQSTDQYEEAFLSWHRKHYPEEWGND